MKTFELLRAILVSLTLPLIDALQQVAILGGAGKIGTAVASHLLSCDENNVSVLLVARNKDKAERAIQEIRDEIKTNCKIDYVIVDDVWDPQQLQPAVVDADCLIHTAGPYLNRQPTPLQVAIASQKCKVYVDVSDPLEFLEASQKLSKAAKASGTTALLSAGAFPGLSNVLAMEAASALSGKVIQDLGFNYFTEGLGGSGDVNLYITNLGFGEPMVQYHKGQLVKFTDLSGKLLGKVDFFQQHDKDSSTTKDVVGRQTVFSWPFPEAATVARELQIAGCSHAGMGTAPDIWNGMLGILVKIVPRTWWTNEKFSQFMADFSQPLVQLTDAWLKQISNHAGETHGMRIDVSATDDTQASIVQLHESFRCCVGQSCAEFALDLLGQEERPESASDGGVFLPEQYYRSQVNRDRIIPKLTTTPGTLGYSGAFSPTTNVGPTELKEAIASSMFV